MEPGCQDSTANLNQSSDRTHPSRYHFVGIASLGAPPYVEIHSAWKGDVLDRKSEIGNLTNRQIIEDANYAVEGF